MPPIRTTRLVRLVRRADSPSSTPSCLPAMLTLNLRVYKHTHDPAMLTLNLRVKIQTHTRRKVHFS
jgi:hypothetical protein